MNVKNIIGLLKDTYKAWSNDNASGFGAALSYYTVFSFPPLLLIAVSIAGFMFGEKAAQGQLQAQFENLIGKDGAQLVQTMISHAANFKKGIVAGVVGAIVLLLGASGVFVQLQTSLNYMWRVKPKPRSGIKHFIFTRLVSFAMVISIGFLLLVSLIISALLSAFSHYLVALVNGSEIIKYAAHLANFVVSFGIITLLFALIYKFLPDVKIRWRDVWLGAVVTAFLFTVGKLAIGLYLGHSRIATAYGAAGSLVIVLAWIYYSSQILFFGAEFTNVYANRHGREIEPAEETVRIEQTEVPPGKEEKEEEEEEAGVR